MIFDSKNIVDRIDKLEEMAKLLNGREYLNEISKEEEEILKEYGLIIAFGYSDDNTEFRGYINEEVSTYNGGDIYISSEGIFEPCECNCKYSLKEKNKCKLIKVIFGKDCTWSYETKIPHKTFDIFDDGELYCKGIIFIL